MNELELEIEDIARTVVCPTCGARPGRRCNYKGDGLIQFCEYSHLSRLKTARGERP